MGDVVGRGFAPFDLVEKARDLEDKQFSGYIVLAVRGDFVEEGVLFFRDGRVAACIVECLSAGKTIKGGDAVGFFCNESKGKGFFQCISLTKSQVDLVLAFDEKLLVDKIDLKDVPRMIPSTFLPKFSKTPEQKSALDAYGLGDLK